MPDYGLSKQQLSVICALSSGASLTAAAQQAGVHRNTINNWRCHSLPFQQGFAHAQYDRAIYFREKMEDLIDLAFKSIQEILTDPKAPASVKLKAALAIMTTACTPPAPHQQVELDIEKIVFKRTPGQTVTEDQLAPAPPVHNDAQPVPQAPPAEAPPPAPTVHKDAQSEPCPTDQPSFDPSIPHNPAQPAPSETAHPAKCSAPPAVHNSAQPRKRREVARNAQCPCGSGKKYKRCCIDLSHAQGSGQPLAAAAPVSS
jgi:hypothetical protein